MTLISKTTKILAASLAAASITLPVPARSWLISDLLDKNDNEKVFVSNTVNSYIYQFDRVFSAVPEDMELPYERYPYQDSLVDALPKPEPRGAKPSKYKLQFGLGSSYTRLHSDNTVNRELSGWDLNYALNFGVEFNRLLSVGIAGAGSSLISLDDRNDKNKDLMGSTVAVGVVYLTVRIDDAIKSLSEKSQALLYLGVNGSYRGLRASESRHVGYDAGFVAGAGFSLSFKVGPYLKMQSIFSLEANANNLATSSLREIDESLSEPSDPLTPYNEYSFTVFGPQVKISYERPVNRHIYLQGDLLLGAGTRFSRSTQNTAVRDKTTPYLRIEPQFKAEFRKMFHLRVGYRFVTELDNWFKHGVTINFTLTL